MAQLSEIASIIALTMGVAWASGINLYAAILVIGLLGSTGNMELSQNLQILQNPLVIFAAGSMYFVEFFADKIQGLDSAWDSLHTFIRIPAGAILAAAAIGDVDPALSLTVAILGGGLAAGTHLTKTSTRLLINTSPEPASNILASLAEDAIVIAGIWTAVTYPWVFLALLGLFVLLMIWLLPILWRALKSLLASLRSFFSGPPADQNLRSF